MRINNLKKAYKEIYIILGFLDNKYIDRIPKKMLEFIEMEKDNEYNPNIDPNIPLENQNLLQDTINILAMLKLDYWCNDEDEKRKLLDLLNENERNYQKELHEKYNTDKLFSKKNEPDDITKESNELVVMPVREKNFIIKLLNKIMKMFKM